MNPMTDQEATDKVNRLKDFITTIRKIRAEVKLEPHKKVPLVIENSPSNIELQEFLPYVKSMCNISEIEFVEELPAKDTSPIGTVYIKENPPPYYKFTLARDAGVYTDGTPSPYTEWNSYSLYKEWDGSNNGGYLLKTEKIDSSHADYSMAKMYVCIKNGAK